MRHCKAINTSNFKTFSLAFLTVFLLDIPFGYGQTQIVVDSLEHVYLQGAFSPEDSLDVLNDLAA